MIEVRNLCKHFGTVRAVEDVSFLAMDGAITGLLGANGAGKTTTMRMISGGLRPDAGDIRIDDARASDGRPELQRRVGALLDHQGLYARLTARENLAYFGQLRGMPQETLNEQVDRILATTGLTQIAGRRTAGFSQGERMKTALGRILVHSPRNLLLDEPTNGLDVPTVRSLRAWLREMRDSGLCVVLSSHVLEEIRLVCDRVVILSGGRVAAQGSPEELCVRTGSTSFEDAFIQLTELHKRETPCSVPHS
jgi:sodium transport system ATP-binding protein